MTGEPNSERIEAEPVGSKEWQAAMDNIPQIVSASRRLIEFSSKNKEKLEEKKWTSTPRNSDKYSSKSEKFTAIHGEAMKGPNGEALSIHIEYPDEASNDPNFVQAYGHSADGYFGFSYGKDSPTREPEGVELGFDQDQWNIRLRVDKSTHTLSIVDLEYITMYEGDRLFVEFKDSQFDKQGNILFPKDKAYISTIVHFTRTSYRREDVDPQDREEVLGIMKDADNQRKQELDKGPNYKEELIKRIGFVPPDNYSQLQQERINNLPAQLNWFEAVNIVNERIQKTIASFESSFQT